MLRGAVFDMDGLMFDSERLTYEIWQNMMDADGYSYSLDVFKRTIGLKRDSTEKIYKSLYGEDFDYEKYKKRCHSEYLERVKRDGVPVKKGLFEILEYLKMQDFKIALATSTSSQSALAQLRMTDVYRYFDAFVCGEDVVLGKPHPEVFLTAAKRLDLAPADCIALEDSINGIKSAYAAGMKTIMIPDFLQPTDEILPKIDFLCADLQKAIEFINSRL